jgi:hypothetical protein
MPKGFARDVERLIGREVGIKCGEETTGEVGKEMGDGDGASLGLGREEGVIRGEGVSCRTDRSAGLDSIFSGPGTGCG